MAKSMKFLVSVVLAASFLVQTVHLFEVQDARSSSSPSCSFTILKSTAQSVNNGAVQPIADGGAVMVSNPWNATQCSTSQKKIRTCMSTASVQSANMSMPVTVGEGVATYILSETDNSDGTSTACYTAQVKPFPPGNYAVKNSSTTCCFTDGSCCTLYGMPNNYNIIVQPQPPSPQQ